MNYIIIRNQPLKQYNTLRLESVASNMIFLLNQDGIKDIYNKFGRTRKIIILGKGSNILLSKKFYDDEYIFVNLKLLDNIELTKNKTIYAEAGVSLSNLSWYTVENNIKGFEFLEDIPGSIGGAIMMNAGTYKDNIGQLIGKVIYYDIEKRQILSKDVSKEDFGKRTSYWSNGKDIVLSCEMRVLEGDYIESLEKILETKKDRHLKQPRNYPSAGSVFIRPVANEKEMQVWRLIDKVGLRGLKKNGAMISDKHPGFIVNLGNATYEDIKWLIETVKKEIKSKEGIELQVEWKII